MFTCKGGKHVDKTGGQNRDPLIFFESLPKYIIPISVMLKLEA